MLRCSKYKPHKHKKQISPSACLELVDLGRDGLHLSRFSDGSTILSRRLRIAGKDVWVLEAGHSLAADMARALEAMRQNGFMVGGNG